jgi:hypothetical protein
MPVNFLVKPPEKLLVSRDYYPLIRQLKESQGNQCANCMTGLTAYYLVFDSHDVGRLLCQTCFRKA